MNEFKWILNEFEELRLNFIWMIFEWILENLNESWMNSNEFDMNLNEFWMNLIESGWIWKNFQRFLNYFEWILNCFEWILNEFWIDFEWVLNNLIELGDFKLECGYHLIRNHMIFQLFKLVHLLFSISMYFLCYLHYGNSEDWNIRGGTKI